MTTWMLDHLLGPGASPLDSKAVADGVDACERIAEAAQAGVDPSSRDSARRRALHGELALRISTSSSPFLSELRTRGRADDELADELIGLALAGWESTAAVVTSAVTLGLPRQATDAQIAELLRLYPPSWLIVRSLSGDEPWGSAGDLVVVSPWITHRSRAWDDAQRFEPSRPEDEPAPIPFGAGPRRCPADLYARTQLRVALQLWGGAAPQSGTPALIGHRSASLLPNHARRNT
jgi:cytochrome P450